MISDHWLPTYEIAKDSLAIGNLQFDPSGQN